MLESIAGADVLNPFENVMGRESLQHVTRLGIRHYLAGATQRLGGRRTARAGLRLGKVGSETDCEVLEVPGPVAVERRGVQGSSVFLHLLGDPYDLPEQPHARYRNFAPVFVQEDDVGEKHGCAGEVVEAAIARQLVTERLSCVRLQPRVEICLPLLGS